MDISGLRVLVTGAGGFIGSRLTEMLVEEGAKVQVLLRSHLNSDRYRNSGCDIKIGDVTLPDTLPEAVSGCDVVFHCAVGSDESLEAANFVNVEGTLNLLKAAKSSGVQRIVHVSSIAVLGDALPYNVTEDLPYATKGSIYTLSKATGEKAALQYCKENDLEIVIIRPTLVYGPRSQTWTIDFLERIKYEEIALIGGGDSQAGLVFIDDLVESMMLAAIKPGISGEVFNISGGDRITWRDLLTGYAHILGKPEPPSVPVWLAKIDCVKDNFHRRLTRKPPRLKSFDLFVQLPNNNYIIDKARQKLGYQPKYGLQRSLEQIDLWLRDLKYLV